MDTGQLTRLFEQVPLFALILARIGALVLAAPIIGGGLVPTHVKALLSIAVSLILAPVLAAKHPTPIPLDLTYFVLITQEVMVGLAIGFVLTLFIEGIRMGGDLMNRYAGFSAAENFDPATDLGNGPMGDLLYFAAVLMFLLTNCHHHLIAMMVRSYDQVPIGTWTITAGYLSQLSAGMNQLNIIAMALSAPVLSIVLAITIVEGLMTRAVPQMNIMHVSFAVKIVLSLLVLWACLPMAVAFIGVVLASMNQAGLAVLHTLH